ncbi:hypothetical protein ACHAAC_01550 [Aeromicrobium sp. CF4.19]|uniref:hypothetical protein n=1 Tax=Aeromicrobium sp. CF4.19 TaxID=3373082 RepID=UPI003EE64E72
MRTTNTVPDELSMGVFHRQRALELGVTSRMLQHPRFVQVFPSVYRLEHVELAPLDWIRAAELTLPSDAKVSHLTRFVQLGLQIGDLFPLHFTIGRDHHRPALQDVFLHRTVKMPTVGHDGVSVAAAFVGAASLLRLLDAVKVGDWLLHRDELDLHVLVRLLEQDHWRPGVDCARRALALLERRSRSLPESEVRCLLVASGLPCPETNLDLHDEKGVFVGCGDLVYKRLRLIIEYEGRQHALDTAQFQRDVHRYAGFRARDLAYVQVTAPMMKTPRTLVHTIHRAMVERGYDGPPPRFGADWQRLLPEPEPWHHRRPPA